MAIIGPKKRKKVKNVKSVMVKGMISAASKKKVDVILEKLNLTHSGAIALFYAQIEMHGGMPFELRVPTKKGLKFDEEMREERKGFRG